MSEYVLILMLMSYHGAGVSMGSFSSREACEKALGAAKELAPGGFVTAGARGVCVKR